MAWPCHSFVDGLSYKCINVYEKRVILINHDCQPILMLLYIMLYIVLVYFMQIAAFSNAVCLHSAFFFASIFLHRFLRMIVVFMLCLGLLTHSLFISCINLHHAQCFQSVGFS